MKRALFVLLPLLVLLSTSLHAAGPVLVRDLEPTALDPARTAFLIHLVPLGPHAVFFLQPQGPVTTGPPELWASDGTPAGTLPLDLPFGPNDQLVFLDATASVAFFLDFPPSGWPDTTLWRTDGTREGTFRLTGPLQSEADFLDRMVIHRGVFYFSPCDSAHGCELWRSDGTVAGTRLLKDLVPGPESGRPRILTSAGSTFYFFADSSDGPDLWRSDGTAAGTARVAGFRAGAIPRNAIAADDRLFFTLSVPAGSAARQDLWVTDGTAAGTHAVAPFDGSRKGLSTVIDLLGVLRGSVLLAGQDPKGRVQIWASDGDASHPVTAFPPGFLIARGQLAIVNGRALFPGPGGALWVSRGSLATTRQLGCAQGCPTVGQRSGYPTFFVRNGLAWFGGQDPHGDEPWVTDGTGPGTRRLADVNRFAGSFPRFFPGLTEDTVFFAAFSSENGNELWSSDGTVAGTVRLGGWLLSSSEISPWVVPVGGRAVFLVSDVHGVQIFGTGGTPGDATPLASLARSGGSFPSGIVPFRDGVLFIACVDSRTGVWASDGTSGGTALVHSTPLFCQDEDLLTIRTLGGLGFFPGLQKGEIWWELWRTDDTPAGTFPVHDGGLHDSLSALAPFRGEMLFTTQGSQQGGGLGTTFWSTDGTVAGTRNLFGPVAIRYPSDFHEVGDQLFFQAQGPGFGQELWRTDGKPEGTRALKALGSGQPVPTAGFLPDGKDVLFVFGASPNGQLWRTDGTAAGMKRILPDKAGGPADIQGLVRFGGSFYFVARIGGGGAPALFRSDGTAAGTVPVRTLGLDLYGNVPAPQLTVAGGTLFFTAADAAHGTELWRTDGTTAGTVLVKDVRPGRETSAIGSLTAAGDRLWFTAADGVHGMELWTSDGTRAGTRMVSDLAPGSISSSPRWLTPTAQGLFFSADDGVSGRELWLLP
jgi:ELWxxDGT repeat protein